MRLGRNRIEPAAQLLGTCRNALRTDVVQQRRIELAVDRHRDEREWIHCLEPLLQPADGPAIRDVGLGDDEAIGHGCLFCGLGHPVELPDAVDGVDQGHDTVQPVLRAEQPVGPQRMEHRNRIGEPGGLDKHTVEVDDFAGAPLNE